MDNEVDDHKCGGNDCKTAATARFDKLPGWESIEVIITWCVRCGAKRGVEMA
jgi:hypothetical protein